MSLVTFSVSAKKPEEDSKYLEKVAFADSLMGVSDWKQAEVILISALREEPANPGNIFLFSNLGIARLQQSKFREAIQAFDVALVRAPKSTSLLTNRARAYIGLGCDQLALQDLNAVLAVDSVAEWPLQARSLLLATNPDNLQIAKHDFELLSKHYPENPWGEYGLGLCAEQEENSAVALTHYHNSRNITETVEGDIKLALCMLRRKQTQEAGILLREALCRFPNTPELLLAMAIYYKQNYQKKEYEETLSLAEKHGASSAQIRAVTQLGMGVE